MTDLQLLDLAKIPANVGVFYYDDDGTIITMTLKRGKMIFFPWNPLKRGKDAKNLAYIIGKKMNRNTGIERRAIVRAAAEIQLQKERNNG